MIEEKNDISVLRLEQLKQDVLLDNLADIDLDKTKSLFDTIMKNLFSGKIENLFISESLMGLAQNEKKKIFDLVRNYQSLCFYKGDFSYWADSIDGVYLNDLELVASRVLDNYDFLLGLAKEGGEEVLKQLLSFQCTSMSKGGSVIEYLRNNFRDDSILKEILIEMSKKDGIFCNLDNSQKKILCTYPEGVLYHIQNDSLKMIPFEEVLSNVLKPFENEKDTSFEDYIFNIYSQYHYHLSLEK